MKNIKRLPRNVCNSLRSSLYLFDLTRVVEELIFNSVEAGATKVHTSIDVGGWNVKVEDNGCGITREGLVLLGDKHATSKVHGIAERDGNFEGTSYKGETLGSLSDVALLEVITKARGRPNGYHKIMKECECISLGIDDSRRNSGTTVIVRDLFYNQVVRRRYMQSSPKKVLYSVRKCVVHIALIYPQISFTVFDIENETELLSTVPSLTSLPLVSTYFGDEVSNSLREINVSSGVFKLAGYLSRPTDNFSSKAFQYIYINSRFVCKGPIHKLIESLAVDYQLSTSLCRDGPEVQSGKRQKIQGNAIYLLNLYCSFSLYDLTFELSKTTIEFKDWTPVLSFIEQNIINFWKETLGHLSPDESNNNEGSIPNDVKIGDTSEKSKETANCDLDCVWNFIQSPSSSCLLKIPVDDFHAYDIQRNSEMEHERVVEQVKSYQLKASSSRQIPIDGFDVYNIRRNSAMEHERNIKQVKPAYQREASSSQQFNYFSHDTVSGEKRFSCPINNEKDFQNHHTYKTSKLDSDSPSNDIQPFDHNFDGSDKDSHLFSTWKDRSIDVDEILKCKSREESYYSHEYSGNVPFSFECPRGLRNQDPKGLTLDVLDGTTSISNDNGLEIDVHRPITGNLFSLAADTDCGSLDSFTLRRCQKKSTADFFSGGLMKNHYEEDMYFTKESRIVHQTTSSDQDCVNIFSRRFINLDNWFEPSYFPNEEMTRAIDRSVGNYAFDMDFDTRITPHSNLFDISKYDEFPKYFQDHSPGEFLPRICYETSKHDGDLYLDSNNIMSGRHPSDNEMDWLYFDPPAKDHSDNFDYSVENYTNKFKHGVSGLINSQRRQVTVEIRSRRSHSAPPFYKHRRKSSITDYHPSDESSKDIDDKFVRVTNHSQEAGITFEELSKPCSSSQTYVDQDLGEYSLSYSRCEKVQHPQNFLNNDIFRDSIANKHGESDSIITKWREGDPEPTCGVCLRSYESSDKNDDILDISSGLLNLAGCFLEPESINRGFLEDARVLPQLDKKFIPIVAGGNLAVIDQHAADERIRLEELRRKVSSGEANKITHLESEQELVLPEMGFQLLQNYTEIIQKWGWICNIHTQSSESYAKNLNILKKPNPCSVVTLVSIPCILGNNLTDKDLVEFLEELAETDGSTTIPPSVNRILNLKACRGAIMFGDALLPSECSLIVEELKATSLCFQCAHGRPTAAPLVNMVELHKQLDRFEKQNHTQNRNQQHGLSRHKPSFKRAQLRLNAARRVSPAS